MRRVLVIVPFPFGEDGIANRETQQQAVRVSPDIEFTYRPVKAGPALFDSHHDYLLADTSIFEAGIEAQEEGFDAVCIDTMSDSGMSALRSVLDIPVIGPARASFAIALVLGDRFSILTQWDPWIASYKKPLREYGFTDKLASIRSINVPPDVEQLLKGKKDEVLPRLAAEAERAIAEDGAEVILLGSTTMHEAHEYLVDRLPVPVINPGPLTYKLAELVLDLRLTHSRMTYPKPHVEKRAMLHALMNQAALNDPSQSQVS